MSTYYAGRKLPIVSAVAVLLVLFACIWVVLPVGATAPEQVCFDVVAGLGGTPGTWSATGVVDGSGVAEFNPFTAGWDAELGQPATVHDRFVASDEYGSMTFQGQGHSALVVNEDGDTVPGYEISWVIISGTGAYATLRGQGHGYAWIDWANFQFLAFQCGQAHYDPQ